MSMPAVQIPDPSSFTKAPLRNRVRLVLQASAADVWTLVGDPGRLPDYSSGLERVEVTYDAAGSPTQYVCHFKSAQEGASGIVSRERVRWFEKHRGWASTGADEVDAFGIRNGVHLVTLEPHGKDTELTWAAHYDADDLDMNKAALDEALGDIAERLVARFGGRLVERFVEAPR